MAIVRCESCGRPQGLKSDYSYVHTVVPTGARMILCCAPSCARPGFIWLTEEEQRQYLEGERRFRICSRASAVVVT